LTDFAFLRETSDRTGDGSSGFGFCADPRRGKDTRAKATNCKLASTLRGNIIAHYTRVTTVSRRRVRSLEQTLVMVVPRLFVKCPDCAFNEVSWITTRGDEVQTAVMCVRRKYMFMIRTRYSLYLRRGLLCCRATLGWRNRFLPPLNTSGTLYVINPTARGGRGAFPTALHINYRKCCDNLFQTTVPGDGYRAAFYFFRPVAFVAINFASAPTRGWRTRGRRRGRETERERRGEKGDTHL